MTLSSAIARVRKITRTSSLSHSDTEIMNAVNEGLRAWSRDSMGNKKEAYLSLAPRFDCGSNWAIAMTVATTTASFSLATTTISDATGGTIAASMETAIQTTWASATVSWSSTAWTFAITVPAAASITIGAPSRIDRVDATNLIFGGGNTQTASIWTSTLPEDCLIETDLPSDFMNINHVEWDRYPLNPIPFDMVVSPRFTSTPTNYYIVNQRLRLYPTPSRQELLHIWYKPSQVEFTSATTDATTDLPLIAPYDDAIVYFAASVVAEENDEMKKVEYNRAKYKDAVSSYKIMKANENPKMSTSPEGFINPRWYFTVES